MDFEISESQRLVISIAVLLAVLVLAAYLGWLLAGRVVKSKIQAMEWDIEEKKALLKEARISGKPLVIQPVASHASKTVYPDTSENKSPDNLTIIDGIGPRTAELLNKEGIYTFDQLAETSILRIVSILKSAGPRFQVQDPTLWPRQAELARENKWEELDKLKTALISGR